jgi:tRNA (cytidine/uridine-2'-O-)-methyltransferase
MFNGGGGRVGTHLRRPYRRAHGVWYIESDGARLYSEVQYESEDYIVFGRETAGLPRDLLQRNRESWLRIPMFNAAARSLNLSNCVGLVLFEALRSAGSKGELR